MRTARTKVAAAVVAVVVAAVALITLAAWLRWGMRCDEGCYMRSTMPGEPWVRYRDSWQWHAQFAVALLALAAVSAALVTVRRRVARGAILAGGSLALAGAWVGWYLATPLHP